ncbi:MAG TPA: hypothetical protein DD001_15765 [Microcoleaceae bacterium UBA10368]|nr:hypothetical protein [Microcoleaceae cyanobacterium UBA10368]
MCDRVASDFNRRVTSPGDKEGNELGHDITRKFQSVETDFSYETGVFNPWRTHRKAVNLTVLKLTIRKYPVYFSLTKIPESPIIVDCLSKSGSDQVKTFQKLESSPPSKVHNDQ